MISAAFLLRRWPKRHDHLVEECVAARQALHVGDVLPHLTGWHGHVIRSWNPPTRPYLTLVPRMAGPFRRWWFLCPRCRRRCEALYAMPGASREDWQCRLCHRLIYASQRYGLRHPLRRVLTHRKRTTRRKDVLRAERRMARRQVRLQAVTTGQANEAEWWATAEGAKWVAEYFGKPSQASEPVQAIGPSTGGTQDDVRALLEAEAERSLATLRGLAEMAKSRRVRVQARRDLGRYAHRADSR